MDLKDIKVNAEFEMVLECIGVDDSSDGLEMYWKVFIGGFLDFC